MKSYIIVIAFALAALAAGAQTVDVSYEQKKVSVKVAEMPHSDVSAKAHDGATHTFACVPIKDVLATVAAPSGEKLRGAATALAVIAGAKDGYRAAFSLAELDESVGGEAAFVCDKQDGKPLAETDGPLRLVVPSDKRPARWVRMLTTLEVVPVK
jgi:hypothetical protein